MEKQEYEEYVETRLDCTINFENDGSVNSLKNVEGQLPEGFIKTCRDVIQDSMSSSADYDMGVRFANAGLYEDGVSDPEELDIGVTFITDNKSISNVTLEEIKDAVSDELGMAVTSVSVHATGEIIREEK